MKIIKGRVNLVALVLGALLIAFLVYGDARSENPKQEQAIKKVRVTKVSLVPTKKSLRFTSVLKSRNSFRAAFTLSGRLVSRSVELGQKVKKGQVLARLDAQPYELGVQSAHAQCDRLKARMTQAEKQLKRVSELYAKKAATLEELEAVQAKHDEIKAGMEQAQAQLAEANRKRNETNLLAQGPGTITDLYVEPNEVCQAGQPIVGIAGLYLEMEVQVPEDLITKIKTNDSIRVEFPLSDTQHQEGTIAHIGSQASQDTHLFPIKIYLPDVPNLKAGMSAEAVMEVHESNAIQLPLTCIMNPSGLQPEVMILQGGSVIHIQAIEILRIIGDKVVVDGEFKNDQEVVTSGQSGLMEGDKVEVLQ